MEILAFAGLAWLVFRILFNSPARTAVHDVVDASRQRAEAKQPPSPSTVQRNAPPPRPKANQQINGLAPPRSAGKQRTDEQAGRQALSPYPLPKDRPPGNPVEDLTMAQWAYLDVAHRRGWVFVEGEGTRLTSPELILAGGETQARRIAEVDGLVEAIEEATRHLEGALRPSQILEGLGFDPEGSWLACRLCGHAYLGWHIDTFQREHHLITVPCPSICVECLSDLWDLRFKADEIGWGLALLDKVDGALSFRPRRTAWQIIDRRSEPGADWQPTGNPVWDSLPTRHRRP